MSLSHWLRGKSVLGANETADIVILGGGYLGLSTAWWITKYNPNLSIILIERATCGSGASGRNAGFLTAGSSAFYHSLSKKWGDDKAISILNYAKESLRLVHDEILVKNIQIEFSKTKSVTLLSEQSSFEYSKFGFVAKNRAELSLGFEHSYVSAFEREGEYKVNPISLINALKEDLQNRKVKIFENIAGFEITESGIKTEVGMVKAGQVIMALNGYFPQFHPEFEKLIAPKRAQMLAVELEKELNLDGLFYDPAERVYWRCTDSRTLIVGGKRLLDESAENSDFDKVTGKIQLGLENYISQNLRLNFKVKNRWSGIMGFTDHELPFISKINAKTSTVMVGGFSGHGMGFGFKAAQETALLVTGKVSQSFFDSFKVLNISL